MKRLLILLCLATVARATTVTVLAQEVCTQENFRSQCPLTLDPNLAEFAILGPVPHDPNQWDVPVGKYNRVLETCQDQGNPVEATLLDSNSDGSAVVTDANGIATLSAELLPGVRWFMVRATSIPMYGPPSSRDVVIVVRVPYPPNTPPTIAKLQRALQWHFMRACKQYDWDGPARTASPAQAWIAAKLEECHDGYGHDRD